MDRETGTDGQRDRHRWTDRQTQMATERSTDGQRETSTDGQRERQAQTQTEINRPDVRKSGRHIPPDDSNDV